MMYRTDSQVDELKTRLEPCSFEMSPINTLLPSLNEAIFK